MGVKEFLVRWRHTSSRRWVEIMGWVIGLTWVGVWAALWAWPELWPAADRYTLGGEDGLLLVQLLAHSFIHYSAVYLLFNLFWLAALVGVGRDCLGPGGFIRLYSLGGVGVVLLCWAAGQALGVPFWVGGGTLPVLTLMGALAVMQPRREMSFELHPLLPLLFIPLIGSILVSLPNGGLLLGLLRLGDDVLLLVLLVRRSPLRTVLFALPVVWGIQLAADLWLEVWPDIGRSLSAILILYTLGKVLALFAGVGYVLAERAWAGRGNAS